MKVIIRFLFKILVFFLLLFVVGRTFLLFYNFDKVLEKNLAEILLANVHGFSLDLSATGYILVFVLLFLFIGNFIKQKLFLKIAHAFIYVLIFVNCMIIIADTALISTWGTKLNLKALSYIFYPELMRQSVLSVNYVVLLCFFIFILFSFFFLYSKFIRTQEEYNIGGLRNFLFIPILFLLVIFVRGGLGNNPIGKSRGVYSSNLTLNISTINGFWNFINIFTKTNKMEYKFFSLEKAEKMAKDYLSTPKDTTVKIFSVKKPNIVLILLESFSSEISNRLGGTESIAPCFDSLSQKGFLFTNFYTTGYRTEQGEISLLSGFPAQPKFSIQRESGKMFKLPILSKDLKIEGYNISFYHMGSIEYARTDEYLKVGQFDKIVSDKDFKSIRRSPTTNYDDELFDYHLKYMPSTMQPFFSVLLTGTTHEPFDANVNKVFKGDKPDSKYKNTVHYTDSCLFAYLQKASKTEWYKNTIFVIVADHAGQYPCNWDFNNPKRYKIPFLLYGEVLKEEFRGKTYEKPACQIDFPVTILSQLDIKPEMPYPYSVNLFNSYSKNFAWFVFDDGFGLIDENSAVVYDNDRKEVITKYSNIKNDSILNNGKAFLQNYMQKFFDME